MLDFAWSEFFLLAIVALIFLGPKELILLFRTLGKWAAKIKALQAVFQEHINQASIDIDNESQNKPR
ncbi:MAG: hypothetical protein K2X98_06780 [Alphaproteobacteria bacterium]|nr:hypothetical protein [Alphaproteobacteria bacterium]